MTNRSRTAHGGRSRDALTGAARHREYATSGKGATDQVRRERSTTPDQPNSPASASTRPPTARDDRTDSRAADDGDPSDVERPVVLLHVEPDADSAELLAAFAERFSARSAFRSVDGMAAALDVADAVDCIVTEQRLPDGSGVELVERLRARGNDVPVAFHTTCRGAETELRAFEAGADAYFVKRPELGQYDRLVGQIRELVAVSIRSTEPF